MDEDIKMKTNSEFVRARIDYQTKILATDALKSMGLSVSDAIRMLMIQIAEQQKLPFEVKVPNRATELAMIELSQAKNKKFSSIEILMDDLCEK